MELNYEPVFSKAKMWAAAIGGTATAVATFTATLNAAFENNGLDAGEIGLIATAVVALVGTVRSVWQVENKRLHMPPAETTGTSTATR